VIHRIRITLTSRSVKSLEKGELRMTVLVVNVIACYAGLLDKLLTNKLVVSQVSN